MKIHPDGMVLLPPSTCALCEAAPFAGDPVIDVERNFNTPDLEYGRKYVCVGCATDIATLLGFASPKEAFDLEGKVAAAEEKARVAAGVDELKKSVDEFVERLNGYHNANPTGEPVSEASKARAAAGAKKTTKKS